MELYTLTQPVLNSRDPGWPWDFDQWIRGAVYVWEGHVSDIYLTIFFFGPVGAGAGRACAHSS